MPAKKKGGKSMAKLKRLVNKPSIDGNAMNLKVVIDKTFVAEYMEAQKIERDAIVPVVSQNQPTIVIESSDDENDDSLVFMGEIKPPEISPKTAIASIQKEMSILKQRNRSLENRLKAMKSRLNEQCDSENQTENVAPNDEPNSSLNISVDEEWVNNEIQQMVNDGQLEVVLSDLTAYFANSN